MKQLRALLTQNNQDPPEIDDAALNSFGDEFTPSYIAVGTYALNLAGAFVGKVFYRLPASEEGFSNTRILVREIHNDSIVIITETADGQAVDGILGNVTGRGTPIEIDVYPE